MIKIRNLYRLSFLLEAFSGLVWLGSYYYFKPNDWSGLLLLCFVYGALISSLVIGKLLVDATERNLKLNIDFVILGHIANVIKILAMLLLLSFAVYFVVMTFKVVYANVSRNLIYIFVSLAGLIWLLTSFFNFFAYILLAKLNRKVNFPELDATTPA